MANKMEKVVIGKRQISRGIKDGIISEIVIAADAEQEYIKSLIVLAKQNNIKYKIQGTMQDISSAYGIDVPSGSLGVLKD
ncbi:MAG: ribosomal L7Ae/L30e/S12e/Gadd45 family protein [Clostridia bacterium]|nr:ribosomal L7Ae/L30e/S12e/Gadd45 family protein [Clostridia bacterium]MBQ2914732.1 ribosomal L7Ae/L30e/S12e/Gadd45 family protein [Clostridia bacterium]MBQ3042003.1 ribosomal L7Ae/L30e/S12e/Gadd45 family protein [Clostridia bacterium]MBQ4273137.1 ribosomal L7Ae/L30e/S12e/Gadd45 family protein [Clostridia bacterium]